MHCEFAHQGRHERSHGRALACCRVSDQHLTYWYFHSAASLPETEDTIVVILVENVTQLEDRVFYADRLRARRVGLPPASRSERGIRVGRRLLCPEIVERGGL